MSELAVYSCIMVFSAFVSSVSQILLKKSAQRDWPSKMKEYLNPFVVTGYGLFFLCTFLSISALKVVPLSMSPILESSGYIFVAVLSFLFLQEKLSKRQYAGIALIILGAVVYTAAG